MRPNNGMKKIDELQSLSRHPRAGGDRYPHLLYRVGSLLPLAGEGAKVKKNACLDLWVTFSACAGMTNWWSE
jgi:hypothetical protein